MKKFIESCARHRLVHYDVKKNLLFLLMIIWTTTSSSADFVVNGLYYNITSDSTVEVTFQKREQKGNYSKMKKDLIIPEYVEYNGVRYTVKSIGDFAFYFCGKIVNVEIPSTVTRIGNWAFYACRKITNVNIPNSVDYIGERAFAGCYDLNNVNIPNKVTIISDLTFWECFGLTNINIPSSVTTIGSGAFRKCNVLKNMKLPPSVTSIGKEAFRDCTKLTDVNIPNSVNSIGKWAFGDCGSLKEIFIPNSVKSIGENAFSGCYGLKKIFIPNSVDSIGKYAFVSGSSTRIIYCENESKPSGWDDDWTRENAEDFVVWNANRSVAENAAEKKEITKDDFAKAPNQFKRIEKESTFFVEGNVVTFYSTKQKNSFSIYMNKEGEKVWNPILVMTTEGKRLSKTIIDMSSDHKGIAICNVYQVEKQDSSFFHVVYLEKGIVKYEQKHVFAPSSKTYADKIRVFKDGSTYLTCEYSTGNYFASDNYFVFFAVSADNIISQKRFSPYHGLCNTPHFANVIKDEDFVFCMSGGIDHIGSSNMRAEPLSGFYYNHTTKTVSSFPKDCEIWKITECLQKVRPTFVYNKLNSYYIKISSVNKISDSTFEIGVVVGSSIYREVVTEKKVKDKNGKVTKVKQTF